MAEITIKFETDNAAFQEHFKAEIKRILRQAVDKIMEQRKRKPCICSAPESADLLFDANGNSVGTVWYKK